MNDALDRLMETHKAAVRPLSAKKTEALYKLRNAFPALAAYIRALEAFEPEEHSSVCWPMMHDDEGDCDCGFDDLQAARREFEAAVGGGNE